MMWVEVNPVCNNTKMLVGTKVNSLTGEGHLDRPLRNSGSDSITVTNYGEIPGHNWVTKLTISRFV